MNRRITDKEMLVIIDTTVSLHVGVTPALPLVSVGPDSRQFQEIPTSTFFFLS